MILHCNYEELSALEAGARAILDGDAVEGAPVLAPPEHRARVEALVPRLTGDFVVNTLAELREVRAGVAAVLEGLRVEMDAVITATHPAHEGAVAAYFDYAHALSVLHRLDVMHGEMEALIELVTGGPVTGEVSRTFQFPD